MIKLANKFLIAILISSFMVGCATQQNKDPIEGVNRAVYKFNDVLDKAALKPVAQGYQAITPTPIQKGVSNFFKNIFDVVTLVNELFQFKFKQAANTTGRVALNTTIGLLGVFDVHSKSGGVRTREDFGQTLGYYGVGSGAYLVLPFFGPSSTRDGIGFFTDAFFFNPIGYINDDPTKWALIGLAVVDIRAEYMVDIDIRDKAFDPYAFMRDSYMQNRENLVKDGAEDPNAVAPYSVPLGS
ncbi:VacJ family lipoprotein [Candidatus Methylopumilus rimovensis]|jgi:phospholipid-binding lipoprotein MlaA|uniref:VacJ family lipoprotein n=1 Tax=Candidatus Methylopumilus rimovensis TaxID=2588535 RepID=A0AAE6KP28_9PROT|nr:VacJ family lipoprotein [Candidatus Methylopumilus rimovensis]QDD11897.1 VacJ family lipoprotein [Candidatus Methylopumilus rimovensis]QDD13187.1 VacJ family lipoprotein [Candidatus Methylopumilus rimovensis]